MASICRRAWGIGVVAAAIVLVASGLAVTRAGDDRVAAGGPLAPEFDPVFTSLEDLALPERTEDPAPPQKAGQELANDNGQGGDTATDKNDKAAAKKKPRKEVKKPEKKPAKGGAKKAAPERQPAAAGGPLPIVVPDGDQGPAANAPAGPPGKAAAGGQPGKKPANADAPTRDKSRVDADGFPIPDPKVVEKVMAIQDRYTRSLMDQKGVTGTATGLDDDGNVVIKVYVDGFEKPQIPKSIEGVPVLVQICPKFYPLSGASQLGRRDRLPRPVPIGVSAIMYDLTLCAAGTYGCRLRDPVTRNVYALSNGHVFGFTPFAFITQPSASDELPINILLFGCPTLPIIEQNIIGQTEQVAPIVFDGVTPNLVDAAIAFTTRSLVGTTTLADGYGTPRSNTVAPFLGQRVQKYGRTTGFRRGRVIGINATPTIGYNEGPAFFIRQIEVVGDPDNQIPFGGPGDSGSLVVDDQRRPVGLLFGGGAQIINNKIVVVALCNRITDVLAAFNMQIDDSPIDNSLTKVGTSLPGANPILPPVVP